MANPRFIIFQIEGSDQFNYRLTDIDNNIILEGLGYARKENCVDELQAVQANCPFDSRYLKKSAIMSYSFFLVTWTGDKLGKSPDYASGIEMESVISKVKMYAPVALVDDLCEVTF